MPTNLTNPTNIDLTEAKISKIEIDVDGQSVVYIISLGYNDNQGNFVNVKRKRIRISGNEFIELAQFNNSYDFIANNSYTFLKNKNYI